jgi:hypothetical protein
MAPMFSRKIEECQRWAKTATIAGEKVNHLTGSGPTKIAPHRDLENINAPDLFWPINSQSPEQVRVNLMLGVFLARVWRLINRNQSHKPHQAANTMATAFVTMTLHVSCHSLPGSGLQKNHERRPRSIPWCFKELLVDQLHGHLIQYYDRNVARQ